MIEKGGHYGPHYATPAGGQIRADLFQAARLMARKLLGLDGKPEGRRRIIPGGTYDAHAAGWEAPTMPGEKKNARG